MHGLRACSQGLSGSERPRAANLARSNVVFLRSERADAPNERCGGRTVPNHPPEACSAAKDEAEMGDLKPKQLHGNPKTTYFNGKPCPKGHVGPRWKTTHGCTVCSGSSSARWAKTNRGRCSNRATARRWHYRDRGLDHHCSKYYGMATGEYDRLYEQQGRSCAICRCPHPKRGRGRLHVDHDHDTGRVRGLLCVTCNTGLGAFVDSSTLLDEAQRYLEANRE